ncbi:hypothetical protein SAMN04487995_4026 [Dyadobacter koreensis]|uniref:Uncharacterized protein n=1 Tax=Dyadobacter koreensis TaxID=408657 RepID=A0A1H6XRS3_9BACT|nr:hypothetical protein [Dyadobacter koreensis]SEJ29467.1 hypothetical protein SAMN04487995_4026 [Dyadobacter koreensis]
MKSYATRKVLLQSAEPVALDLMTSITTIAFGRTEHLAHTFVALNDGQRRYVSKSTKHAARNFTSYNSNRSIFGSTSLQTGVQGKVPSIKVRSVPGSNVSVKDLQKSTAADPAGSVRFSENSGSEVPGISFIGYKTHQVIVGNQTGICLAAAGLEAWSEWRRAGNCKYSIGTGGPGLFTEKNVLSGRRTLY